MMYLQHEGFDYDEGLQTSTSNEATAVSGTILSILTGISTLSRYRAMVCLPMLRERTCRATMGSAYFTLLLMMRRTDSRQRSEAQKLARQWM
jgi:hypothetical protein